MTETEKIARDHFSMCLWYDDHEQGKKIALPGLDELNPEIIGGRFVIIALIAQGSLLFRKLFRTARHARLFQTPKGV